MKRGLLFLIVMLVSTGFAWSQARNVTGTVKSADDGETLIGVSIRVRGADEGTITDIDGNFSISVPEGKNVLIINYLGFVQQEIRLTEKTNYDIKLASDNKGLDEVVVVGYGTVKRKDLTGSVSSVSSKELKDIPVNSAAEALTGRLAGVNITSTEGQPGAAVTVRVRGGGSITQDNSPIYIVDGVQIENALSIISPQEIESVDVLKDAATTAIYGARGANGVVIITTKSGMDMPTKVSYDMYFGQRNVTKSIGVLDPYDFVMAQYQSYNYQTDQTTKDAFTSRYGRYEDLDIYKNIPKEDWQDDIFGRNAKQFTQNLNVMGGTKTSSFSLTITNSNEEGVMLNSGFTRKMASFRFDHKLSKAIKFGFSARYSDQRIEGAGTSNTGTQGNNRLRNAVRYKPFLIGNETADEFDPEFTTLTNLVNPLQLVQQEIQYTYRRDLLLNANVSIELLKGLTLRSVAGVTPSSNSSNQFSGPVTSVARQNSGMPVVVLGRGEGLAITNSNTLAYTKTIKKHKFDVLAGQEIYRTTANSLSITTKYLPVDITAEEAFGGISRATPPAGLIQDAPSNTYSTPNVLSSYFGRANYSYDSRYMFTATFRRDGSSVFAPGYRWGNFPSVAVAWRLSNEKFWQEDVDPKKLLDIKVRASYGAVGNNRIKADLYKTMFSTSTSSSYGFADAITPGLASTELANPYLKWETTISRNLGFDFSMFNNRLNAVIDIYSNTTKDLLLAASIPSTAGYTTQQQNIGSTRNSGYEIQLNTTPVSTRNFLWNSNFNIAHNTSKVLELGTTNGTTTDHINGYSGWITSSTTDFLVELNKPLGQFYGYVNDGYYKISDFDYDESAGTYTLKSNVANNRTALGNRDPQPGDMKFKKLDKSDTSMMITDKDQKVIGNALPKFTGGWNNQFSFKNFDLSVFVYFSIGNDVYNANKIEFTSQYNYRDNNFQDVMKDSWKRFDNTGALVTDPVALAALNKDTKMWAPSRGQYTPQSYAIEDGSFLRISNITLGYTFPDKWVKKTKIISSFRIYGTVNNLYTFTHYTGYDPEVSTRRSTPLTPGVDYSAYPRSRLILAGLNIKF